MVVEIIIIMNKQLKQLKKIIEKWLKGPASVTSSGSGANANLTLLKKKKTL